MLSLKVRDHSEKITRDWGFSRAPRFREYSEWRGALRFRQILIIKKPKIAQIRPYNIHRKVFKSYVGGGMVTQIFPILIGAPRFCQFLGRSTQILLINIERSTLPTNIFWTVTKIIYLFSVCTSEWVSKRPIKV